MDSAPIRQIYRSRRHPNLWVIDKENGGKADALNALRERQALIRVVRPFLEDASTVAAGGILRIANGCVVKQGQVVDVRLPGNLWAKFQVLEYLRAFLSGRMGWDALDATLVISGAFGIFKRSTVVEAGGENFGYGQLSTWWRLKGTWSAIRKVEGWGRMQRKGFTLLDNDEAEV